MTYRVGVMTGPLPVFVRLAAPAERPALEALQRRASLANPGDREAILAHPDAIGLPLSQIAAGDVLVAEQEGAILGFAAVLQRPDGDAELDALFVDPALWKRGVGRLLVDRCAAMAQQRGSRILHVVGNPHAEGFYGACGFRTTGTVQTLFGVGLSMQREV
jgi:GNAT superfamily N-acetyltransferase